MVPKVPTLCLIFAELSDVMYDSRTGYEKPWGGPAALWLLIRAHRYCWQFLKKGVDESDFSEMCPLIQTLVDLANAIRRDGLEEQAAAIDSIIPNAYPESDRPIILH